MLEGVVIGILFIGAIIYLLNMLKHNFRAKEEGCAKGCGTCATTRLKSDKQISSATSSQVHQ
jgi:hypothetical protein